MILFPLNRIIANIVIGMAAIVLFTPVRVDADEVKPVLIGATVSLEGKYQEPSAMIRSGYHLWERQVNSSGGILGRPVRLIMYNDRSDPERARRLYRKLITEEGVDLVFSPYGTPLTLVASEISERHGMVMLVCGASGEKIWNRGYRRVFGMYAMARRYFVSLLDLMARQDMDSIAILYEKSPFNIDVARGTEAWAKRFGVGAALIRGYEPGGSELAALLKTVKDHNPDGLVLSAYPEDGYAMLRLMQQHAYRPHVVALTIAPIHPEFRQRAGRMAENVFGPSQWEPDERIPFPGTKKFIADFHKANAKLPSYHAGSAYAACRILEKTIRRIGSIDHDQIRQAVAELDTVTVIGRFKVDATGKQIGHNPILIQWQNGKKQIVYPPRMQTAAPRMRSPIP